MDIAQIEYLKEKLEGRMTRLIAQADETLHDLLEHNIRKIENIDRASLNADQTLKLRIRNREHNLIKKIREALERIETGDYGICELCGDEIAFNRLDARPVTTKCIDCKQAEERTEMLVK